MSNDTIWSQLLSQADKDDDQEMSLGEYEEYVKQHRRLHPLEEEEALSSGGGETEGKQGAGGAFRPSPNELREL